MKLKLLEEHEHYGTKYSVGDEIEVTQEEYDFLISYYKSKRQELVKQVQEQEEVIETVKKTKRGAK